MSTTSSVFLSDFHRFSQFSKPLRYQCRNLSARGKRKRGGGWQTSMDTRDRHRRRTWYVHSFLVVWSYSWIAGIITGHNSSYSQARKGLYGFQIWKQLVHTLNYPAPYQTRWGGARISICHGMRRKVLKVGKMLAYTSLHDVPRITSPCL